MSTLARDCPICQSSQTNFFVVKNGHNLSKCSNCGLVYIDPELPPVSLEPLYNEQGAPEVGERYPYDKIEHRRKRAKIRTFRLRKYLVGKHAIDLGCGGGYMVDAMQNAGANATGIDLDPEAIAFAKANHNPKANYFCENVDTFLLRGQQFDFGHSSQVIEHVGNFNEFVEGWAKLIKSGGFFFLKTPDREHWRLGQHPETWPNPPHYTQYFNKKNIAILLEKHGFEVHKMYFNWKAAIEVIARRK